jgi:hypothetical protein
MAGGIPTTPTTPTSTYTAPSSSPTFAQPAGLSRNQKIGLFLSAISDAYKGQDVTANMLQRQAMLQGQSLKEEQRKKQQELDKQLNIAIDKSNLPQSQKDLFKKFDVQTKSRMLIESSKPKEAPKPTEQISKLKLDAMNALFKYGGNEEAFKTAEPALYKIYTDTIKKSDQAGILDLILKGGFGGTSNNTGLIIEEINKG